VNKIIIILLNYKWWNTRNEEQIGIDIDEHLI